jgi:hypothetical protein
MQSAAARVPYPSSELKTRLERREERRKANDEAHAKADREHAVEFECLCECVEPGCEERFPVKRWAFRSMRAWVPNRLAMADGHTHPNLERVVDRHPTTSRSLPRTPPRVHSTTKY